VRFTKYHKGDEIKDDDVSEACSTHGRDEKCVHNISRKPEGKNHSEELVVDGKIILE
jgi:hypothetical protein